MFGLRKNPYRALEKQINYSFSKRALLDAALVHRSFRFEKAGTEVDNQRLEFLGDAVLGLAAADHIYRHFEEHDEGVLTSLRSLITSGKALARIARLIGLGEYLRVGKGEEQSGGRYRDSMLADALEAVIGAAYLDGGHRAADKIFRKLFVPALAACNQDQWSENPKGRLQEMAQRRWGAGPRYRVVHEEGPLHARIYTVEVHAGGSAIGHGMGSSKREAEVRAATEALRNIDAGRP